MKPEVTILVLTYKRLEGLKRLLKSINEHTKETLFKLLVMIDNEDIESYNFCKTLSIDCILSSFHRDFTAQANMGTYVCETPYFCILSDDMEIVDDGWLGTSLRLFKQKFPDGIGLMSYNEGLQNGRIFTCGMSSKRFIHYAGGHMYDPKYVHYGGDNVLTCWARDDGKYFYADVVKINHYHPSHKIEEFKAEDDETYQIAMKSWHQDQVLKKEQKDKRGDLLKNKNYHDWF